MAVEGLQASDEVKCKGRAESNEFSNFIFFESFNRNSRPFYFEDEFRDDHTKPRSPTKFCLARLRENGT